MPKILIVDDSSFMRKILKDILSKGDYNDLVEAENGIEALDKCRKEKPDAILLDIIMPVMDGIKVLEQLNQSAIDKVIIISAVGQEKMREKAKTLGVEHYITKPFKNEKVLEMLKEVLG